MHKVIGKIMGYFKESYQELTKVTWPTKNQARNHTIIVIAISAGVLVFFAILDYVFEYLIRQALLR